MLTDRRRLLPTLINKLILSIGNHFLELLSCLQKKNRIKLSLKNLKTCQKRNKFQIKKKSLTTVIKTNCHLGLNYDHTSLQ